MSCFVALVLFILIKVYIFEIVKVTSKDMLSTYRVDDILLIKKCFNEYATNDIVYFKFPRTDSGVPEKNCIQRLIGLPGDTIEIRDKSVYINNFRIHDTSSLQFNYFVKAGAKLDSNFKLKYHLIEGGEISKEFDYSFSLNKWNADSLRFDTLIKKTEVKVEQKGAYDETVFPYSVHYNWNRDQFGKLYIPKKDDVLHLDSMNINIYAKLIRYYEKNELTVKKDSIFINDELTNSYKVRQDYYFTMG
ncbi:MAG: family signal peptidase, partial [Bacteroidetes bacterium]|nr:family signal peptidase [Bacteroidota bacterium]